MKAEINSRHYVTILGWMVSDLHLKGNELIVYAIIHGFSQDGETVFSGSLAYLQAWTGRTKKPLIAILKKLQDKGLLLKRDKTVGGVHFCEYKTTPVVEKVHQGGVESTPNNNNINSSYEDISINPLPPKKFSFRAALLGLGVEEAVADAWLQVRKNKRATNSEIAFNAIAAQIAKSGRPANECIRKAVEKSWSGFDAAWLQERPAQGSPARPRNVTEDLLALGAEMFGPQQPVYDEQ